MQFAAILSCLQSDNLRFYVCYCGKHDWLPLKSSAKLQKCWSHSTRYLRRRYSWAGSCIIYKIPTPLWSTSLMEIGWLPDSRNYGCFWGTLNKWCVASKTHVSRNFMAQLLPDYATGSGCPTSPLAQGALHGWLFNFFKNKHSTGLRDKSRVCLSHCQFWQLNSNGQA